MTMKKNVAGELEAFRRSKALPALLSKEFLDALTKDERAEVVAMLCEELKTATLERHGKTVGMRVARVNKTRKEKGEL